MWMDLLKCVSSYRYPTFFQLQLSYYNYWHSFYRLAQWELSSYTAPICPQLEYALLVWDPHLCKNLLNHGMSNITMIYVDHLGNYIWTLYAYWKVITDIWFTNCLFFQTLPSRSLTPHITVLALFTVPLYMPLQKKFITSCTNKITIQ